MVLSRISTAFSNSIQRVRTALTPGTPSTTLARSVAEMERVATQYSAQTKAQTRASSWTTFQKLDNRVIQTQQGRSCLPTLRSGSSGENVRVLQLELRKRGYDVGPIDGIFGRKTDTAVRAFQRSVSISVDGIAGPVTLRNMGLTHCGSSGSAPGGSGPATQSAPPPTIQLSSTDEFMSNHMTKDYTDSIADIMPDIDTSDAPVRTIFTRNSYGGDGFDIHNKFELPGYSRSRMSVLTYENSKPMYRVFEFLINPTGMSEMYSNVINPIKTGGGFFILRSGPNLPRVSIGGFFVETKNIHEKREFLDNYYNKYLVDKRNAFHDFFNENSVELYLEGYRYDCHILDLSLSKSASSMFLYQYQMQLLITNVEVVEVHKE